MVKNNNESGTFQRIGSFFDSYWAVVATTAGGICLSLSGMLTPTIDDLLNINRWQSCLVWLAAFLFFASSVALAAGSIRTTHLRTENQQLRALIRVLGDDIQDKWRNLLIQVFKDLGLGNDCRISVYRYEDSNFIMLGRFSPDPMKQKTGRGFYPADQGCIGKAHREKVAAAELPEVDSQGYYEVMVEEWGISAEVVAAFTMKPRSILAFAVEERGTYNRPLVIVFESTSSKAFATKTMRKRVDEYNDTFCGLVKELEPLLPSVRFAKERGF